MPDPIDPDALRRAFKELDALDALPSETNEPLEAHLIEGDVVELRTADGYVKMAMPLSVYDELRKHHATVDLRTPEGAVEVPLPAELKGDEDAR